MLLCVSSPEAPYLDGGKERSGAVPSPTKRPDPGREVVVNVVGKNVRDVKSYSECRGRMSPDSPLKHLPVL